MKPVLIVASAVAAFALAQPTASLAQGVGVQVGPVGAGISFAPEQRTQIREYVVKQKIAPTKFKERVTMGTKLPADVELHAVPNVWGPSVAKYRYVYSDDRVYFVEPSSREVVYVLEN